MQGAYNNLRSRSCQVDAVSILGDDHLTLEGDLTSHLIVLTRGSTQNFLLFGVGSLERSYHRHGSAEHISFCEFGCMAAGICFASTSEYFGAQGAEGGRLSDITP